MRLPLTSPSLWPLLHYMAPRAEFRPAWFAAYRAANRRFAEVVLRCAEPDDLVCRIGGDE